MLRDLLRSFDRRLGLRNRLRGLPPAGFDLDGEKVLDWGWCLANLSIKSSMRVLDIGCAQAPIIPAAIALGHEAIGVDTAPLNYALPGLTFYHADFMAVDFGSAQFDAIVLCSVVEHIGLAGRYAQRDQPDGDLQAMRKVATLLKSDGVLILTIPVGRDIIFSPWHRIYGVDRLKQLLQGYSIRREQYLIKKPNGVWHQVERRAAEQVDRGGLSYALGEFVLTIA